MSVNLVVGGVSYVFPTTDDETWGDAVTSWSQAVSSQLLNTTATGDIGPTTSVTIANNQATPLNVNNLVINSALYRAGFVEYFVQRTTSGTEISEAGTIYLLYNDLAGTWSITQVGDQVNVTGVSFTVTAGGQVQYTSSNITGQTSGKMRYRLRVLSKT